MAYSGKLAAELLKAYFEGGNAAGLASGSVEKVIEVIILQSQIIADKAQE